MSREEQKTDEQEQETDKQEQETAKGDGYYLTTEDILDKGGFGKIYKAECKNDKKKKH